MGGVRIAQDDGGRRLVAKRDVKPGEVLVSVPREVALCSAGADDLGVFGVLGAWWERAEWVVRLAVVLLDERAKGERSTWKAYIDALPRDPGGVLWACETLGVEVVMDKLRTYEGLEGTATAYREYVERAYEGFVQALPKEKRSLVSWRDFCWAVSCAQTRAFGIPRDQASEPVSIPAVGDESEATPVQFAMFPGLDMANHSVHCQTSFAYDTDSDSYKVTTGATFASGEQVYISYGPKSNEDLMLFYGFVEGNNPANTVSVGNFLEWMCEEDNAADGTRENWHRKERLLRESGLVEKGKTFAFNLDGINEDLMMALRISFATEKELSSVDTSAVRAGLGGRTKFVPLSLENELLAWGCIYGKVRMLLDGTLTDFDDEQRAALSALIPQRPCSASWTWGECGASLGETLYRYESQAVLSATCDRVQHYSMISSKIGRVCTVLMPPTQSLLKTSLFGREGGEGTSGVYKFMLDA